MPSAFVEPARRPCRSTQKSLSSDAGMIDRALTELTLPPGGVLFIENVGNLVCPASFDLGEHQRIVIASVTEGEDKALKYPDMFARADPRRRQQDRSAAAPRLRSPALCGACAARSASGKAPASLRSLG